MTHMFKLSRRTARLRAVPAVIVLTIAGGCNGTDSLESNAAPVAADLVGSPSFATAVSPVSISNISVQSGKTYQVASGLAVGSQLYTDRTYTVDSTPSTLQGLTYIRAANDDKDANPGSTSFLSFDIGSNAIVYVGHDNRLARPSWLTSNFQDTGMDLVESGSGTRLSLFKRSYAKGRVTLGSNVTSAAGLSMYTVLVQASGTTTTTTTVPATTTTTTGSGSLPVGLSGLPYTEFTNRAMWSGGLEHLAPSNWANTVLRSAKAAGAHIIVDLVGGRSGYKNSDGTFNLSKWKYNLDKWRSDTVLKNRIADGTVIGHYLIDEPYCASCWGNREIGPATIEEMARYSKSIWPTMATGVRSPPSKLLNFTWQYLDFAWAQWEGPLRAKVTAQQFVNNATRDAQAVKLKLVLGLNYLDAGDGTSKIWGTYLNAAAVSRWQMSAAEVDTIGRVFASAPYACALMSWAWVKDPDDHASWYTAAQWTGIKNFIYRSDVRTALAKTATLARSRTAPSCKR